MRRSVALSAAAALLLLLAVLAAVNMSTVWYRERSEEMETHRMFKDWMAKYNKTYDSIGEEEQRYAVFKENLRRHVSINVFGDLTNEELRSMYPGCVPSSARRLEQEGYGCPSSSG